MTHLCLVLFLSSDPLPSCSIRRILCALTLIRILTHQLQSFNSPISTFHRPISPSAITYIDRAITLLTNPSHNTKLSFLSHNRLEHQSHLNPIHAITFLTELSAASFRHSLPHNASASDLKPNHPLLINSNLSPNFRS